MTTAVDELRDPGFAPAKVNLTLHVTGQRDDGYHLLDSLVAFANIGDQVDVYEANTPSLTVEGPEAAGVPADMNNLVLRAAGLLNIPVNVAYVLTKNLPVAAGIGGGSADAAAALRSLYQIFENHIFQLSKTPDAELIEHAKSLLKLGADVPVCFMSVASRVGGIGEKIKFAGSFRPLPAVLVNPRVSVSTPAVFKALERRNNPEMTDFPDNFDADAATTAHWLAAQRNDLEAPAVKNFPVIGEVLNAISGTGQCLLSRMSGSGATCFGLYPDGKSVVAAAEELKVAQPGWWVQPCVLGHQHKRIFGDFI